MKKIVIHRAGSYDQLRIEEVPDPTPRPDEVVIDVHAIGINYADVIVRMGLYSSAREFVGWPITPGFEIAGRVEGRPVMAVTRFGGYASRVVVPEDQVLPILYRNYVANNSAAAAQVQAMSNGKAPAKASQPRPARRRTRS